MIRTTQTTLSLKVAPEGGLCRPRRGTLSPPRGVNRFVIYFKLASRITYHIHNYLQSQDGGCNRGVFLEGEGLSRLGVLGPPPFVLSVPSVLLVPSVLRCVRCPSCRTYFHICGTLPLITLVIKMLGHRPSSLGSSCLHLHLCIVFFLVAFHELTPAAGSFSDFSLLLFLLCLCPLIIFLLLLQRTFTNKCSYLFLDC